MIKSKGRISKSNLKKKKRNERYMQQVYRFACKIRGPLLKIYNYGFQSSRATTISGSCARPVLRISRIGRHIYSQHHTFKTKSLIIFNKWKRSYILNYKNKNNRYRGGTGQNGSLRLKQAYIYITYDFFLKRPVLPPFLYLIVNSQKKRIFLFQKFLFTSKKFIYSLQKICFLN